MLPFKLAKMKLADAPFPPLTTETGKDEVFVLATWPVGPLTPAGGMAILPLVPAGAAFVTPLPAVTAKRVAVWVPWFEVQKGLVAV